MCHANSSNSRHPNQGLISRFLCELSVKLVTQCVLNKSSLELISNIQVLAVGISTSRGPSISVRACSGTHMIGKWPQQCTQCPSGLCTSACRGFVFFLPKRHSPMCSRSVFLLQVLFVFSATRRGRIYSSIMSPTLGIGLSLRAFLYPHTQWPPPSSS